MSTDPVNISLLTFIQVSSYYRISPLEETGSFSSRDLMVMTSNYATGEKSQRVEGELGSDHQHSQQRSLFS